MHFSGLVVTLIHAVVQVCAVLVFPIVAWRGWRDGGHPRLLVVTLTGLALVGVAALIMASEPVNRLTATHGYDDVAPRVLVLYAITLGLPMLTSAAIVRLFDRASGSLNAYGAALAASFVVWIIAMFAAVYLMLG